MLPATAHFQLNRRERVCYVQRLKFSLKDCIEYVTALPVRARRTGGCAAATPRSRTLRRRCRVVGPYTSVRFRVWGLVGIGLKVENSAWDVPQSWALHVQYVVRSS